MRSIGRISFVFLTFGFLWILSYRNVNALDKGNITESPTEKLVRPSSCQVNYTGRNLYGKSVGVKSTVELGKALGLILGFGVFAAVVALVFHLLRVYVFHDADNLDTAFDAGGNVSIGLTATTIVSQWTWSATLLQSATVASKYGVSGPFWYAAGATIQIILFAILSIELKTKAPGAKTFLQVVRARFGKATHIVFCVFAGFTNFVVMSSLLLAGTAVLTSLVQDLNLELASMVFAVVMGAYTLIGGLGATFYVSYFNTTLIFSMLLILVVEVYYNPYDNPDNPIGSPSKMYTLLSCIQGPEGNEDGSWLTFLSSGGLMFGVINIVGNFGTVFCDQSYWQSSIAAKPIQGVWGFISGGLTWFAIPFTMATTMGLAYLALSAENGAPLLSATNVDEGLVPPVVAQQLLGTAGEYVMLLLILMAVMSTGSAEIIAVASIIIYDIYKLYINPFRENLPDDCCPLCAKHVITKCKCVPVFECYACRYDRKNVKLRHTLGIKPPNTCPTHGYYRQYLSDLLHHKNWCITWVTLFTIPMVIVLHAAKLNLSWVYLFTGVLIGSAVIPIFLTIVWDRVHAAGMIAGAVGGCLCGLTSWLIVASTYPGGLSDFITNTGKEVAMLVGNCVSIGMGGLLCVVVSLIVNRNMTEEEKEAQWERTRNIDNPLSPWLRLYIRYQDIKVEDVSRPPMADFLRLFRKAKITAYVTGVSLTVVLVLIWPGIMAAIKVFSEGVFVGWAYFSQGWAIIAATFIIIVPLTQEIMGIVKQVRINHMERHKKVALNDLRKLAEGIYKLGNPATAGSSAEFNQNVVEEFNGEPM